MVEITQVSEQSDAAAQGREDRVAMLVAAGWFIGVMLLVGGLLLIEFRVPDAVTKWGPWAVAIAIGLYIRFSTPSSKLLPTRRALRHERRAGGLVGVLSALTLLAAIAEASSLHSWADWAILAGFVSLAVGGILMLHVRFTIGP